MPTVPVTRYILQVHRIHPCVRLKRTLFKTSSKSTNIYRLKDIKADNDIGGGARRIGETRGMEDKYLPKGTPVPACLEVISHLSQASHESG